MWPEIDHGEGVWDGPREAHEGRTGAPGCRCAGGRWRSSTRRGGWTGRVPSSSREGADGSLPRSRFARCSKGWESRRCRTGSGRLSGTGRPRRTDHPREVVEAALAHIVKNKVEAAYMRSDLFERRRRLMDEWAEHVSGRRADSGA